jgi:hypothetical protein
MVDFNNETTIGTPAIDIVRVLVLQRRNDLFEAYEKYLINESSGVQSNNSIVRARLKSWFLEHQAYLKKRKLTAEEYAKLLNDLNSEDIKKLEEVIYQLNEALDDLGITKIDTKKVFDTTRVELENQNKNL